MLMLGLMRCTLHGRAAGAGAHARAREHVRAVAGTGSFLLA
jgi:hypothetical protein